MVTLYDCNHLTHVIHVVIWQMQKFMFHCKLLLSFFFNLMAISEYKTQGLVFGGAIYRRVFCVTNLGGLYLYLGGRIHRGAYFGNFAVVMERFQTV